MSANKRTASRRDSNFAPRVLYTADQLEDLAFQSASLPDGLEMAQTLLFLSFRALYDYAKRIQMPPEQGRKEKQRLLQAYDAYRFRNRLLDRSVTLWKTIEQLSSAYRRHDRSDLPGLVAIADEMMQAVYGMGQD